MKAMEYLAHASTTNIQTKNVLTLNGNNNFFMYFPFQISRPPFCEEYYDKYIPKLFPIHNTFLFCFEKKQLPTEVSLEVKYQERQPVACH